MTPTSVNPYPTGASFDSAENPRKLSALRADVSRQSDGNDASLLSCFSSAQAPYPSFRPKTAKTRSLRCFSSSHRTRFAGLRREPCFVLRRAEDVPKNPPESGSKSLSGAGYAAPPRRRPHSGSQGRTRGFIGVVLLCQFLLYLLTFGGSFGYGQLVLVELLHRLSPWQQGVEQ